MNFWAQYISRPVAIYCRNFSFGSFKRSHRAEKEKSLKFVLSQTIHLCRLLRAGRESWDLCPCWVYNLDDH